MYEEALLSSLMFLICKFSENGTYTANVRWALKFLLWLHILHAHISCFQKYNHMKFYPIWILDAWGKTNGLYKWLGGYVSRLIKFPGQLKDVRCILLRNPRIHSRQHLWTQLQISMELYLSHEVVCHLFWCFDKDYCSELIPDMLESIMYMFG